MAKSGPKCNHAFIYGQKGRKTPSNVIIFGYPAPKLAYYQFNVPMLVFSVAGAYNRMVAFFAN